MDHLVSRDWWMWQITVLASEFVHNPSAATEAKLKMIITEYRNSRQCLNQDAGNDEHAWSSYPAA